MRMLPPRTILGRTILVLLGGLVVSQLASLMFYATDRSTVAANARLKELSERISSAARAVDQANAGSRPMLIWSLRGPGMLLNWSIDRAVVGNGKKHEGDNQAGRDERRVLAALEKELDKKIFRRIRVSLKNEWSDERKLFYGREMMGRTMQSMMTSPNMERWLPKSRLDTVSGTGKGPLLFVSVELADKSWLNVSAPFLRLEPFWTSRFFLTVLAITAGVFLLSVWAVWRATVPLKQFAMAAEKFGRDVNAPPLSECGPLEVYRAARAFNEMQERLRTLIRGRTQMFAAISHDLRTPITRLRLRAEFVEDDEQQKKMLSDLGEMEDMISASLAFARDEAATEKPIPLDICRLLRQVCVEATETGEQVSFDGPATAQYTGRPLALKRAFENLVGNALKYGGSCKVTLCHEPGRLRIIIDDQGPGIADDELENVFTPFYRLESSRAKDTGGVGLGLAVVRAVMETHGGEVSLANLAEVGDGEDGLRATVILPEDAA